MTTLRRILSVLMAAVFTVAGLGLLLFGTGELPENRLAGLLITLAGIAVLLMVVQTGHVSSAGLMVMGVVTIVFGLAGLLSRSFAIDTANAIRPFSHEIARGSGPWLTFGFVLALGLLFGGASIASWTARRPTEVSSAPAIRVVLSVILALAAAIVGIGFLTRPSIPFVIVGAVVIGVTALTGMVSSAGLYVVGALLTVVGLLSLFFTSFAQSIVALDLVQANGMRAAVESALELGFVAAFGAILLASGLVVRAARARAVRKAASADRAAQKAGDETANDKAAEDAGPAPEPLTTTD